MDARDADKSREEEVSALLRKPGGFEGRLSRAVRTGP